MQAKSIGSRRNLIVIWRNTRHKIKDPRKHVPYIKPQRNSDAWKQNYSQQKINDAAI